MKSTFLGESFSSLLIVSMNFLTDACYLPKPHRLIATRINSSGTTLYCRRSPISTAVLVIFVATDRYFYRVHRAELCHSPIEKRVRSVIVDLGES